MCGGKIIGICTRSKRPDYCENEGLFEPCKKTAYLLWQRCACGLATVLLFKEKRRGECRRNLHDCGDAPVFPARNVREEWSAYGEDLQS